MYSSTTRPRLKSGTQLSTLDLELGERSYLVRIEERCIRVSEYVYRLLGAVTGRATVSQIAETLSVYEKRNVNDAEILWVIEHKLEPMGFLEPMEVGCENAAGIRGDDGGDPSADEHSLAAVRWSPLPVLTGVFRHLYTLPSLLLLIPLVISTHVLVYAGIGLSEIAYALREVTAFGYLSALVLVVIGIWFHELGHLAACRHFGCPHGGIAVGFKGIIPRGLADTRYVWVLPRAHRAIVDLGGAWFQLLSIPVLYLLYRYTGAGSYLLVICLLDAGIVWVLTPSDQSDGYWLLADLLGLTELERWHNLKPQPGTANEMPTKSGAAKRVSLWLGVAVVAGFGILTGWMAVELALIFPDLVVGSSTQFWDSVINLQLAGAFRGLVEMVFPGAIILGLVACLIRFIKGVRRHFGPLRILLTR